MYSSAPVPIPKRDRGISVKTIKGQKYVYYDSEFKLNPVTKKWIPQSKSIGKLNLDDQTTMFPNENYDIFFPEEAETAREALEANEGQSIDGGSLEGTDECDEDSVNRTYVHEEWVTKVGVFIVIKEIVERLGLVELLKKVVGSMYTLFLDLIVYMIINEDNTGWHYPTYAKEHALFSPGMQVVSDSTISRFYQSISEDAIYEFLDEWIATQDHDVKVYVTYDSTNKNCQAGDVDMADYGAAKDDPSKPIFNYAVAYDLVHQKPLLYEYYPGCINDLTELQTTIETLYNYGYKLLVFIIDRGYFSIKNIRYMDKKKYGFIIMVKGKRALVHDLISEVRGTFEINSRKYIAQYNTYGTTVTGKLYPDDSEVRYFHIYYSSSKAAHEQTRLHNKINDMGEWLNKQIGKECTLTKEMKKYYKASFENKKLVNFEQDYASIDDELEHCGYFAIISSEEMTAADALILYKSRDVNEKLFRVDKSYLGDRTERTHDSTSTRSKVFVSFSALLVRNEMYVKLKKKENELNRKLEHMTVEGAIDLLESIKIVRTANYKYRLANKVTKKQREILSAFSITPSALEKRAMAIGANLRAQAEKDPRTKVYKCP